MDRNGTDGMGSESNEKCTEMVRTVWTVRLIYIKKVDRYGTDGMDSEIFFFKVDRDGTDGMDSEIFFKWTEMVRTVWTVRLMKSGQRWYGRCGQ